jgi:hypothetical protein
VSARSTVNRFYAAHAAADTAARAPNRRFA